MGLFTLSWPSTVNFMNEYHPDANVPFNLKYELNSEEHLNKIEELFCSNSSLNYESTLYGSSGDGK